MAKKLMIVGGTGFLGYYTAKLALEKGKNYSSKVILNYLDTLADIDNNIKSGVIDKNLAFELFLLGN